MNERPTSAGISFFDVARAIREVERAHGGKIAVHAYLPVREVRGIALDFRVAFTRRGSRPDSGIYERGATSPFPTVRNRTVAGLLLRLVLELDATLTEETDRAARAAQARLFQD